MIALMRDRRGSADLIQFVLILPIFVLIFYGFFEVWRLVSVKQSLHAGTYQAARYLSVNNDRWRYDRAMAVEIVHRELENNGLLGSDGARKLVIYIPSRRPGCYKFFNVGAELDLPWSVIIPFLPSRNVRLVEQHTGYIECGPTWAPTPTPMPTPTPTPTPERGE